MCKKESAEDNAARKTADATIWIAIFTLATVIVSLLTWSVLSRQLDEMKAARESGDKSFDAQLRVMDRQATAMQGQLDALKDSNEINRKMLLSQRASVSIKQVKMLEVNLAGQPVDQWTPTFENTGNTIATQVFFGAVCVPRANDSTPDTLPLINFSPPMILGAKSEWPGQACNFSRERRHQESGKSFYALFAAQYHDVFNVCHVTMVSGFVSWSDDGSFTSTIRSPICTDNDCPSQCGQGVFAPLAVENKK